MYNTARQAVYLNPKQAIVIQLGTYCEDFKSYVPQGRAAGSANYPAGQFLVRYIASNYKMYSCMMRHVGSLRPHCQFQAVSFYAMMLLLLLNLELALTQRPSV